MSPDDHLAVIHPMSAMLCKTAAAELRKTRYFISGVDVDFSTLAPDSMCCFALELCVADCISKMDRVQRDKETLA